MCKDTIHRSLCSILTIDYFPAWTQDALIPVVMNEPTMSMEHKIRAVRSLSKAMWIQNDLFSRHYTLRSHDVKSVNAALKERDDIAKDPRQNESLDTESATGSLSKILANTTNPKSQLLNPDVSLRSIPAPKEKKSFLRKIGLR